MLGRLILTTVGTSALDRAKLESLRLWNDYQNLKRDLHGLLPDQLHEWLRNNFHFSQAEWFIANYIKEVLNRNIADEVKKPALGRGVNIFSAELSSLYLMYGDNELGLNPAHDNNIFLLSESPDGILSGIINQRLLSHAESKYLQEKSLSPQLTIVPGLQMDHFKQFFTKGLPQFVKCVRKFTKAHGTQEAILNITGGFKALVVYSTYLALALPIQMVFVFEELTDVVKIRSASVKLTDEQSEQLIHVVAETDEIDPPLLSEPFDPIS